MVTIESQLKLWLLHRGMSVDAFANLALLEGISGSSATRLRQAFGGRYLDGATTVRVWELRNEVEALCRSAEPLVLDLSNAAVVRDLLNQRREFNQVVEEDAEYVRRLLSAGVEQ